LDGVGRAQGPSERIKNGSLDSDTRISAAPTLSYTNSKDRNGDAWIVKDLEV